MTICRSEVAKPMLRDIFATWDDWHGELHTVTGFEWSEYRALYARISGGSDAALDAEDLMMLEQAANQFFGYPGIRTDNLKAAFGNAWLDRLTSAFREEQGR
jgi:hypothetical protein